MALKYEGHKEVLDPTPVELPIGYSHPQTIEEKIAQAIRQNDFNKMNNQLETFEEADDFECDDDQEFTSQYEMKEMQDEPLFRKRNPESDEPKKSEESSESDPKKSSGEDSSGQAKIAQ